MYVSVFFAGNQMFPNYDSEAYPAGVGFPVKREEVNLMRKNLRGKIREYIQSEEGKGVLSLGLLETGLVEQLGNSYDD